MKKAEIVLGASALIALAFNLLFIPGGNVLTVLLLSSLAVLYMYLSFALFNDISLKAIFKRESYKGKSIKRIVGAVLSGLALAVTIIGILFKVQAWPGASVMVGFGTAALSISLVVGVLRYARSKSGYYTRIFKRIAIYGGLGFILMLLPDDSWLALKYRNHPHYVEAVKNARAHPDKQELWDKVDEERRKMMEER